MELLAAWEGSSDVRLSLFVAVSLRTTVSCLFDNGKAGRTYTRGNFFFFFFVVDPDRYDRSSRVRLSCTSLPRRRRRVVKLSAQTKKEKNKITQWSKDKSIYDYLGQFIPPIKM